MRSSSVERSNDSAFNEADMVHPDEERRPLLKHQSSSEPPAGLPWRQVIVLGIWRGTHAVYFGYILTWIMPFLLSNELADPLTVGTTAGWIESAYSIGILTGLAPASYLSDSIGRKPTAISGVLLASIGTVAFGFANTVPLLIIIRFFIGTFVAFIPATVMTAFIELASPKTLPTVFAVSSFAWTLGSFVAPGIGGFLAEPAEQYPAIFRDTIWERYPYALPGVVAVFLPVLSVVVGCFVLEETLPEERKRSIFSLLRWAQVGNEGGGRDGSTSSTPLKGLFTRPVCYSLFCWGFLIVRIVLLSSASPLWRAGKKRVPCMSAEITTLQFMFLLHLVAEVLFLSSPEDIGGLQFSPREMGILFSIRPLLSNIFNVLAYPTLARRYSTESIFKWGMAIVCTSYYAGYLIFGLAASWLHPSHQTSMIVLFGLAILSAILGASGTACSQSLTSRSPSRAYLNKLNTAAEYTANAMHALGVIAGSNLWTLGAKYHILNGQLVWLVLVALSLVLAAVLSNIETLPSWQEREEEERAISPTSS